MLIVVTVIIVRLICSLPTSSFVRKRGQIGDVTSNTDLTENKRGSSYKFNEKFN